NPVWSEDGRWLLFCGTQVTRVPEREHDWWITGLDSPAAIHKTMALPQISAATARNSPISLNRLGGKGLEWRGRCCDYFNFSGRFGLTLAVRARFEIPCAGSSAAAHYRGE